MQQSSTVDEFSCSPSNNSSVILLYRHCRNVQHHSDDDYACYLPNVLYSASIPSSANNGHTHQRNRSSVSPHNHYTHSWTACVVVVHHRRLCYFHSALPNCVYARVSDVQWSSISFLKARNALNWWSIDLQRNSKRVCPFTWSTSLNIFFAEVSLKRANLAASVVLP